jgi:hypothetical protein
MNGQWWVSLGTIFFNKQPAAWQALHISFLKNQEILLEWEVAP